MKANDILFGIFVITLLGSIFVAVILFFEYKCSNLAATMNIPHQYSPVQGCMIEPKPGQWIPLANYRVL